MSCQKRFSLTLSVILLYCRTSVPRTLLRSPRMANKELKLFDYDKAEIGEELGSYEYTLTQEMLDAFRTSVDLSLIHI